MGFWEEITKWEKKVVYQNVRKIYKYIKKGPTKKTNLGCKKQEKRNK